MESSNLSYIVELVCVIYKSLDSFKVQENVIYYMYTLGLFTE